MALLVGYFSLSKEIRLYVFYIYFFVGEMMRQQASHLQIRWYQSRSSNAFSETCMVSTHNDYKISGQELFPRIERSISLRMLGENYEGEEEEELRVRLDCFE